MNGSTEQPFFGLITKCLYSLGCVLARSYNLKQKIALLISSLVPLLYLCLALPDWIDYLVNVDTESDAYSDDVMYMIAFICATVRGVILRLNVLKLGNLLHIMENIDVPRAKPKLNVNAEIAKSRKILNRIVALTFSLPTVAVILATIRWFFEKEHSNHLPFGMHPQWALNITYIGSLIYQVVSFTTVGTENITVDCLLVCMLILLLTHYRNIPQYFYNLTRNSIEDFSDVEHLDANSVHYKDVPWEYFLRNLKEAIEYHVKITEVAKEIEDIFHNVLLVSFTMNSLVTCFSIFRITNTPLFGATFWNMFLYLSATFDLFFLQCCLLQKLIDESWNISDACFQSYHPGIDIRIHNALIIIMSQSQNRPVRVTIGKFVAISHAAIITVSEFQKYFLYTNIFFADYKSNLLVFDVVTSSESRTVIFNAFILTNFIFWSLSSTNCTTLNKYQYCICVHFLLMGKYIY
ncbi:odorant receptor 85c-like isoform X2 [Photinus pyralis]|uniref:odorant receptor 85c-like isoform X2 n=1 Tax=Photinus pyralis TaxID=7054 RepID=UPI001266FEA7|nr:odorant receptor 85c-like isoform X2 [Photinus pyralis]